MKLEVAHRFCMKYVQRLNMNTSTDFTLSCIDMPSIETILDYRKLQFFGQLCRLSSTYLSKQVFTHRLLRYYNMQMQYTSFIADIYWLLVKYGMRYILDNYIETGAFPPKCNWKRLLTDKVVTRNKQDTLYRLNTSVAGLSTWLRLGYPCLLWLVSKKRQELAPLCTRAVRILSKLV